MKLAGSNWADEPKPCQGAAQYPIFIWSDVISLGGSISQNPDFIQGVRSAIAYYVDRHEEYSVVPEILA